jgi:hypothetical protein
MKDEHKCIMEEKIDILTKKVDQILIAMKGNDMGTTGVIPRLERCEKKISILQAFKSKTTTVSTLIASAIATIITCVIAYFSKS